MRTLTRDTGSWVREEEKGQEGRETGAQDHGLARKIETLTACLAAGSQRCVWLSLKSRFPFYKLGLTYLAQLLKELTKTMYPTRYLITSLPFFPLLDLRVSLKPRWFLTISLPIKYWLDCAVTAKEMDLNLVLLPSSNFCPGESKERKRGG